MIVSSLQRNSLFVPAALPLRVFPPLFNRYQGGQSFGNHVDKRHPAIGRAMMRVRTELSCTLFLAGSEEYDGGELVVEDTYGAHSGQAARGAHGALPMVEPPPREAGDAREQERPFFCRA